MEERRVRTFHRLGFLSYYRKMRGGAATLVLHGIGKNPHVVIKGCFGPWNRRRRKAACDERLLSETCSSNRGIPPNYVLALRRLSPYGVEVVQTKSSSLKEKLPFADGEFDLVLNRHSAYNASEVARVLKSHGFFLTEQVDGRDLEDLCKVFGCKPQWSFFTLNFALNTIKSTELVVVDAQEWKGKTVFKDVGALVYFLKAIPWIVPGFTVKIQFDNLLKLQERIEKEEKLTFTQRLFLIKAEKP